MLTLKCYMALVSAIVAQGNASRLQSFSRFQRRGFGMFRKRALFLSEKCL
jgi:hypothetical protein